jgi:NAD(P)H dehydrogenase (quinone)
MIAVTGATGKLGRLVVEGLLKKVPATEIIAVVRNPEKASDLAARGVQVRQADYNKPETLPAAFAGVEKVLLISGNEVGRRIPQHTAVIAAAKSAGVQLFAYTSLVRADTSPLTMIAGEHKATEEAIRASGMKYVILRNAGYFENHTGKLGPVLQQGSILSASGDSRYAAAARADYAAAAVAVLTSAGHENKVYELAGDYPFTLAELAAEVARQSGKPVSYKSLSPDEYRKALVELGTPPDFVDVLVGSDLGASLGGWDSSSRELHRLIGRPTATLAEAVAAGLKNQ